MIHKNELTLKTFILSKEPKVRGLARKLEFSPTYISFVLNNQSPASPKFVKRFVECYLTDKEDVNLFYRLLGLAGAKAMFKEACTFESENWLENAKKMIDDLR
jgi:hypothetical protein